MSQRWEAVHGADALLPVSKLKYLSLAKLNFICGCAQLLNALGVQIAVYLDGFVIGLEDPKHSCNFLLANMASN